MTIKPLAYINVEERKLEWAEPITWHTPTIAQMDKVPLYTHQYSDLTDMEIIEIANKFKNLEWAIVAFARAILRKAQAK
jgi:hypothetical protein